MFVSAVVPAAGYGLRLRSPIPKPLVRLNKKPILIHTLSNLSRHANIKEIILVVSAQTRDSVRNYIKKYRFENIKELVVGGQRRRDSVSNGLGYVSGRSDLILIHDAVRPFIELEHLNRVIEAAERTGAAVLGLPVKSTVKEVNVRGVVVKTLKRERIYEIQTPQVFQRDLIISAYKKFPHINAVDDASLVERLGRQVAVVPGSYFNIKITTPEDLVFAEAILSRIDKGVA